MQISPDLIYSYPLGNAELPTAFDAFITNAGQVADTFNISLLNAPAGFTLVDSLPSVTIPAGGQAQIGVCAVPTGALAAPGTMESFNVAATSATNPAITATGTNNFTVPQVQGEGGTRQHSALRIRPPRTRL